MGQGLGVTAISNPLMSAGLSKNLLWGESERSN